MGGVVTISSSFGASGNSVGHAVAEQLGLPFFDRAIPTAVATRLSVPLEDALGHDEMGPSVRNRLARAFAHGPITFGPPSLLIENFDDPARYREETERILFGIADTTGGVILGRAGMIVLRNRPDVLRIRLDGPVEARIAHVIATGETPESAARTMQRDVDRAREAYVRVFYKARQSDPELYHAIFEVTSLGDETCTAVIVDIARRHLARWLTVPGGKPTAG